MDAPRGAPALSDVLRVVLQTLERAPRASLADALVGSTSAELATAALAADEYDEEEEPAELPEELDEALRAAAARGAAAKLASLAACTSRASRAAADSVLSAEVRTARGAHAEAMHACARVLREVACDELDTQQLTAASLGLVAWCGVADAATTLRGRYADATSAADKWRTFARDFAVAAEMPSHILDARHALDMHDAEACASLLLSRGRSAPTLERDQALVQLANESRGAWRTRLVELAQSAPA